MPPDAFSDVMGDRHGATRPVDEGANDPWVILLNNPGDEWHVLLLRERNELLMNLAALGLTDKTDETRELLADIGALVVYALRENPETSDGDLDKLAV